MVPRFVPMLLLLVGVAANHYKTLGVPRDASADSIKASYRKIALKHHPDRMPRNASPEFKQSSQRTFEAANNAFEVLSDPAQRRQYDFELANPIQQGEDGIHRQGAPNGPRRPLVTVQVSCGLEHLGGWQAVDIPLSAWSNALGAAVTAEIASRLGLPRRIYLPPGSNSGDTVRKTLHELGPTGLDVDFCIVAHPRPRWRRSGPLLSVDLPLPAWHNVLGAPPVKLRSVDGELLQVRPRGERVQRQGGTKVTLPERGMPIPREDEDGEKGRGDLQVHLRLRTVPEEIRITGQRLVAAAVAVATANAARKVAPSIVVGLINGVTAAALTAQEFIATEILGRATVEARQSRARARRERRLAAEERRLQRQRRRAERDAARKREERARRLIATSEDA